jgi:DNA repair exonuclease SbcCD ATPase subunit
LPVCPNCGTSTDTPSRVFSVIVEPKEGDRGLTQRKVGMYQCATCSTKFPTIISRQKYLVVSEDQLKKIQGDLEDLKNTNEDLQQRLERLVKDQEELQESLEQRQKETEIGELETKLQALERQVTYLIKERGELEEKVSKFR